MRRISLIAQNTFREIVRDRILYGLIAFAVLLIGVSVALGQLSFAEQIRISTNFGLTAIHLGAAMVAIFLGSTLVSKEIDRKTVFTLLVRPVSRIECLVGKQLGLMGVVLLVLCLLGGVLASVLVLMGMELKITFLWVLVGVLLEALVLLSLTLFFSAFSRPISTICFSIGMFLIGHWIESLRYFVEHNANLNLVWFGAWWVNVLPNLEVFNWRSLVVYEDHLDVTVLVWAIFYGFAWFSFFISLTSMIFWKRDFD